MKVIQGTNRVGQAFKENKSMISFFITQLNFLKLTI